MKSSKGLKYEGRFTRKSFIQYKESMEKFLIDTDSTRITNINDKGIYLQGIKNTYLKKFIKDNCAQVIDKHSAINKKFSETKASGKLINYKKLKDFVKNENIFNEIISASIGAGTPEKKSSRLKTLLEKN
jgi:hypothetical protein